MSCYLFKSSANLNMKNIFIVLCASVLTVSTVPINGIDGRYPRFIEFPDGEGNLIPVDLKDEVNIDVLENIVRNPADNVYHLYTRRNPKSSQILVIDNADSISSSYFNPSVQTVVIAHGWLGSVNSALNPVLRDVYLEKSDVNIIVLDWIKLAAENYITAVRGVPAIGRGLAWFLNFLNQETGASFDNMHLIGFSLGAHLVGNTGRELDGKVERITGLDPAGPLWNLNNFRLNRNDAVYVEVIHTDGSSIGLGIGSPIGRVDFFPNGGKFQPGCPLRDCNHDRAWQLLAATITYNHLIGRECANRRQVDNNTCRGDYLHMGNDILNKDRSGLYRVNTGASHPF